MSGDDDRRNSIPTPREKTLGDIFFQDPEEPTFEKDVPRTAPIQDAPSAQKPAPFKEPQKRAVPSWPPQREAMPEYPVLRDEQEHFYDKYAVTRHHVPTTSYFPEPTQYGNVSPKSRGVAFILTFFFGFLGVQHLYLGCMKRFIIWWMLAIPSVVIPPLAGFLGLWWLSDIFCLLFQIGYMKKDPQGRSWRGA